MKKNKNKTIIYYNNKYNKCQKLIDINHNEAYKITNSDELKKIYDIKIKEYEKINHKINYLEINDICLLNPILIKLKKETLIPNKENT